MRESLATIQKIKNLRPIPNADKIEVAEILGWECVVKKGEFKVNDLIIYIEVDAVLPSDNPYFDFMKERKYRVRTIKLRGQISQGLVCPLSILPKVTVHCEEGSDVTKVLNIKHYEDLLPQVDVEPEKSSKWAIIRYIKRHVIYKKYFHKKLKGGFPSFLKKTDEERIQKHPNWLNYDYPVYITEKIDGTSATYFVKKVNMFNTIFGVCTRNCYQKTIRPSYYWNIAIKEKIEKKLKQARKDLGIDICIQGEIIGPKIQDNKYKKTELEFYVYNVYDITRQEYFCFADIKDFCSAYSFKMVPIDCENTGLICVMGNVSQAVEYSKDQSKINPTIKREGIVVRSVLDQKELSFKVINPEFSLEYNE